MNDKPTDIKGVFLDALALPEAERAKFVTEACGANQTARDQVAELLKAHGSAEGFMQSTDSSDIAKSNRGIVDSTLSDIKTLGPFELKRELGRGGFGQVYLGVRRGDVKQYVAIKLLNKGLDTSEVIRRFRQERKFLAALRHEYIAHFVDAGESTDGRPYYVMEYVDGRPIDQQCQVLGMTTTQRLRLFLKVCAAVQLAHNKFVLHRDLKPSNILVRDDGTPKLVDFGIAKAINPEVWGTILTVGDERAMTYEYASPEQVRGGALDVRSDVYSLGVVLYEILTGQRPYHLDTRGHEEALRVICQEEPLRPSEVVRRTTTSFNKTNPKQATSAASPSQNASPAARPEDSRQLRRHLQGDLDNLVMFALRKDPARRYESVQQLADDIEAYLSDAPLRYARPESRLYVLKRTVHRHRRLLGASMAIVLALAAGLGATMVMYIRAEQRADQLRRVTEFQQSMLGGIDVEAMGRGILAEQQRQLDSADRQLNTGADGGNALPWPVGINATDLARTVVHAHVLERAVRTVESEFGSDAVVESALRQTIGDTYYKIGMYAQAQVQMERALDLRRKTLEQDHPDTLESITSQGRLLHAMGQFAEAEVLLKEALRGNRQGFGEDHPRTLRCISALGDVYLSQGQHTLAEPHYRTALSARERTLGYDHADTIASVSHLGRLLLTIGKPVQAAPLYQRAVDCSRRTLGPDHPNTLAAINSMGELLRSTGKLNESVEQFGLAWEGRRRALGDDHPSTLDSLIKMGSALTASGDHDTGRQHLYDAVTMARRILGTHHPDTLTAIGHLANALRASGREDEAEAYYREVLAERERALGPDHPDTLTSVNTMGLFFETTGKLTEAERHYQRALDSRRRTLGVAHPDTLTSLNCMVGLLRTFDRSQEAEPYAHEALAGHRKLYGDEHPNTIVSLVHMGCVYSDLGKLTEAEAHFKECVIIATRTLGDDHWGTVNAKRQLGRFYQKTNRRDQAKPMLVEVLEDSQRLFGPNHPDCILSLTVLGILERELNNLEAAETLGRQATERSRKSLAVDHPSRLFAISELGQTLGAQKKYAEAETELLEAFSRYKATLGDANRTTIELAGHITAFYEHWNADAPGEGHEQSATSWRAKASAAQE